MVRKPDHEGVVRLGAGHGDQLDPQPAEREGIAVLEEDVGRRDRLVRELAEFRLGVADRIAVLAREREAGAGGAEAGQAAIVGLVLGVAAWAITFVPGSRRQSVPPTWST